MALNVENAAIVIRLVRELPRPAKVLGLGHPDVLATPADLAQFFGGRLLPIDNDRVRSERIGTSDAECIGSAFILFEALGAKLTVVEKRAVFGVGVEADLNYPLLPEFRNAYDLVVDSGTIEHVLNVGQAMVSVITSLRVGGYVYHCNPLSMFNHGYWNFSPVAYHDFYAANGFEVLRLDMQRKNDFIPLERETRFRMGNDGKVAMICVAKKIADVAEITFPMQAKYQ